MNDLLTVAQIAKELGVTTRTIRNYQADGKLVGQKIGGQWKFTRSELLALTGNKFKNPLVEFMHESHQNYHGITVFDIPITNFSHIDRLKQDIINQYNAVYDGQQRKFHYVLLDEATARITIQGPHDYIANFGNWIVQKINVYQSLG